MKFYGIDKLSLVDYDEKLSCTLFTAGCNFRCPFCHNSSLVISTPENYISEEDVLKYLSTRTGILDAVAITGGEPTLNNDLIDFISKVKKLGFLVKLDTNGHNPEMIKYLIENNLIDYIAMDIKNSKEKYALTTGLDSLDISNIKKTVELLLKNHIDYEFRTTIIKEFHESDDFIKIGEWLKGAKKYRIQKFIPNENCIKQGLHEVSKENALAVKDIIQKYIDDVELRNY